MFGRVKQWFSDVYTSFTEPGSKPTHTNAPSRPNNVIVPVLQTESSRFVDEDGFKAHEFYEEDSNSNTMQRVPETRLHPEGVVALDKPALPHHGPVLMQNPSSARQR